MRRVLIAAVLVSGCASWREATREQLRDARQNQDKKIKEYDAQLKAQGPGGGAELRAPQADY